jgi:iron complex transport system substrate-binding protein
VDAERLSALHPDLVITQMQCEVCAVSERDVNDALQSWSGERPHVVSLQPNSLADVWDDIARVAAALGREMEGEQLVTSMRRRMAAIAKVTQALPHLPTVACIEWIDPLMAAGNWMPTLVEMAGGINLFGKAGEHSPWMKFEELESKDPELILISPCGFGMDRAAEDLPALTGRPEWKNLRAVRERRVFMADGNQYFNRPGPRIVESLEILGEIFHPELFSFGHEGTGWRRL